MKRFSRKIWSIIYVLWFFAITIFYTALLLYGRGRMLQEGWDHILEDGIGVILVTGLGGLFMFFYGRRVEAWKKRLRRRSKGTVWGIDVGACFKKKKGLN